MTNSQTPQLKQFPSGGKTQFHMRFNTIMPTVSGVSVVCDIYGSIRPEDDGDTVMFSVLVGSNPIHVLSDKMDAVMPMEHFREYIKAMTAKAVNEASEKFTSQMLARIAEIQSGIDGTQRMLNDAISEINLPEEFLE